MPLLLQLLLPQPVDDDVDADVDRRADDEEQQPHVDQLRADQCQKIIGEVLVHTLYDYVYYYYE